MNESMKELNEDKLTKVVGGGRSGRPHAVGQWVKVRNEDDRKDVAYRVTGWVDSDGRQCYVTEYKAWNLDLYYIDKSRVSVEKRSTIWANASDYTGVPQPYWADLITD